MGSFTKVRIALLTQMRYFNFMVGSPFREIRPERSSAEMVRLVGGRFKMGGNSHYRKETSARIVAIDPYMLDRTTVTNGDPTDGVNGCCATPHASPHVRKLLKGGSHLCEPNHCRSYRPPRAGSS